jgi:hypothetical protein
VPTLRQKRRESVLFFGEAIVILPQYSRFDALKMALPNNQPITSEEAQTLSAAWMGTGGTMTFAPGQFCAGFYLNKDAILTALGDNQQTAGLGVYPGITEDGDMCIYYHAVDNSGQRVAGVIMDRLVTIAPNQE